MLKKPDHLQHIDDDIIYSWIENGYKQYLKTQLKLISDNSYNKGFDGEKFVQEILDAKGNSILSGDLTTKNIMIEVKNYDTTIPFKEVEKFYRDLSINNFKGGIFVSLKSKISKKELFEFDMDNKVIFICTSNKELIQTSVSMLDNFCSSLSYIETLSSTKVLKRLNLLREICNLEHDIRNIELLRDHNNLKLNFISKNLWKKNFKMREILENLKIELSETNKGDLDNVISFIKDNYKDSHLEQNIGVLYKLFNNFDDQIIEYKYNKNTIEINNIIIKVLKSKTYLSKEIDYNKVKLNKNCKYDKGILTVELKDYEMII